MIKSKIIRWPIYEALMRETRNGSENVKGRDHMKALGIDGRTLLNIS
jgi:hypothetical protein